MSDVIAIRASLKLATRFDCFSNNQILENKILFVKDLDKDSFIGIYKIGSNNEYYVNEVNQALQMKILYTLISDHSENNFCFKLFLRAADEYDILYTPKYVIENKVYYLRSGENVTGPYSMSITADVEKVKNALRTGCIYVPCNKQKFEPIIFKKTA